MGTSLSPSSSHKDPTRCETSSPPWTLLGPCCASFRKSCSRRFPRNSRTISTTGKRRSRRQPLVCSDEGVPGFRFFLLPAPVSRCAHFSFCWLSVFQHFDFFAFLKLGFSS